MPYARASLALQADCYLLTFEDARLRQTVRVDAGLLRPLDVRLEQQAGGLVYSLVYEGWQVRGGRPLAPGTIRFEMPGEELQLRLKLSKVEPDVALADALFALTPPDGVPVEAWE